MATERWETLQVDGQPMRTFLALPDAGNGPWPAVIVAHHAGAVDNFIQEATRRLAANGIAGIAPDLFHRLDPNSGETGMQRLAHLRDREVVADMEATLAYVQRQPEIDRERLGIKGYCMGGRIAYMMAAANPAFKVCVAFYGGNTKNTWGGQGTPPFDRLKDINGSVLSFFGGKDGNPSAEDAFQIDAELKLAGVLHEFHSYPTAGHAYMDFTNPARYNQDAAQSSWPIAVDFLRRHLLRGAPVPN